MRVAPREIRREGIAELEANITAQRIGEPGSDGRPFRGAVVEKPLQEGLAVRVGHCETHGQGLILARGSLWAPAVLKKVLADSERIRIVIARCHVCRRASYRRSMVEE